MPTLGLAPRVGTAQQRWVSPLPACGVTVQLVPGTMWHIGYLGDSF